MSSERKKCPACGADKLVSEYRRNVARPDGLSFYCRECFKAIDRAAYQRRREAAGFDVRHRETPPNGFKWCPDCGSYQPVDSFALNRASRDGRCSYCKPHTNERNRERHFVLSYGMAQDEVEQMVEQQRGACLICERPLGSRAHVDHDHATGKVRGVLCFNCNGGLGQFRDDPDLLRRAADYLDDHMSALTPAEQARWPSLTRPHRSPAERLRLLFPEREAG